eukprot:443677-Prymnesium_polylepis.1
MLCTSSPRGSPLSQEAKSACTRCEIPTVGGVNAQTRASRRMRTGGSCCRSGGFNHAIRGKVDVQHPTFFTFTPPQALCRPV